MNKHSQLNHRMSVKYKEIVSNTINYCCEQITFVAGKNCLKKTPFKFGCPKPVPPLSNIKANSFISAEASTLKYSNIFFFQKVFAALMLLKK